MRNRVLLLAVAGLLPFAAASAQQVAVALPRNVLSIQPINAVLTVYSAEYERRTGAAVTLGLGGTFWELGDGFNELTYKGGDLKLRYYPSGTALEGFSFGGTVGVSSIKGTDFDGNEESASGPSAGVLLEYQWLLGTKRNIAVALGGGAKAVFVNEDQITSNDFIARYPTARISVGFAF